MNIDPTVIEAILTAIAAVFGAYATILSRKTGQKTASREETQQIIDAQNDLLDRYEKKSKITDKRIEILEKKVEDLIAERMSLLSKIAELST